jgi:hypothetical protein
MPAIRKKGKWPSPEMLLSSSGLCMLSHTVATPLVAFSINGCPGISTTCRDSGYGLRAERFVDYITRIT